MALHNKMLEEQSAYRDWLLGQSPEEILNHAYEYTVREDIVMTTEWLTLPEKQAAALLESPSPLADIFKDFEKMETDHMDNVRNCIECSAENLLKTQQESTRAIPIYQQSGQYAVEHGELDVFRASRQANEACKKAIEAAIQSGYDGMYLRPDVKGVLEEFGSERVSYVLAATIQSKDWDERFSRGNKAWAETIPMFETKDHRYAYVIDSHSMLLDGFVTKARKEMDAMREQRSQKPSIKAQLAAKPVPSGQTVKPKDKETR